MQCALCKETIDDDSWFCDQCGEHIMVCPVCGRPGKGKRCIFDGKELVPAENYTSTTTVHPAQMPQQTQTPLPAQPVQAAPTTPPAQSGGASGSGKVKLTSQIHSIMIEAQDGDIIGRKAGAFVGIFGRFNFVSGTHCKLVKTAAGWNIEDMGSTNGTFYNGSRLAPNTLYPLSSGTTIKIADVELLINYDEAEGGTARI